MRKNFGAKPFLYPQPVMILGTYDENGKANAMNAAWGGIVGANEIIVDLSAHKTTDNIIKNRTAGDWWNVCEKRRSCPATSFRRYRCADL